ncbi:hypothetical protein [Chitinophaga sp. OAE865]|uniref:hypothetical protein n=1 Tax=Chitinophaga sp. OAE865 TaxID=2817898 RepID=UPI001AE2977D
MSTSTPLAWLAGAMLLFSCNKDHISPGGTAPETSAETVFPVTFDAGGFTQQLDSFGRKADATLFAKDSLDGHVKYLYYKVYGTGAQADLRHVIVQQVGTPSFGIIRDTLPPGNYKFTLLATGDEYRPNITNAGFKYPGSDAFSTHFEMVVNGPANAKVSLDRIVARLQFIIQDPLPADAAWMDVRFGGIPRVFNFPTGQVSNPANGDAYSNYTGYKFQIPTYNQGKPGFKTQAYFPLQGSYTVPSITVMCWGANGNLLASKVINDVKFETNKRTVLKGNLFAPASSGIEVDLNDTKWKPDSIAVFY